MGRSLKELGFTEERQVNHFAVKESVFPFNRFPGVDAVLGPEMKSTGEVMGIDYSYGMAFAKSQLAANQHLPLGGTAFISVRNQDKRAAVLLAKRLADLGFKLVATRGTARALRQNDLEVTEVHKVHEGRPHVIDLIKNGQIQLIINTTSGSKTSKDLRTIRSYAVTHGITLITTISGAQASVNGIEILKKETWRCGLSRTSMSRCCGPGSGSCRAPAPPPKEKFLGLSLADSSWSFSPFKPWICTTGP